MFRFRVAAMAFALVGLCAGTITTVTAGAAAGATAPIVPTLTQISATHHPGFDRLVFQFSGPVPAQHSARYVSQVIGDASACRLTWSAAPDCSCGSRLPPGTMRRAA